MGREVSWSQVSLFMSDYCVKARSAQKQHRWPLPMPLFSIKIKYSLCISTWWDCFPVTETSLLIPSKHRGFWSVPKQDQETGLSAHPALWAWPPGRIKQSYFQASWLRTWNSVLPNLFTLILKCKAAHTLKLHSTLLAFCIVLVSLEHICIITPWV